MGGFANTEQENAPTQVYYDPAKQQYFSYKPSPATSSNVINTMFGLNTADQERNYYGNSLTSPTDRFTPQYVEPNYPNMNELFPALDIGLAQNLQNSLLAPTNNTPSSGAGRFLSPSNTQGK
jgi:hypothetical protein